MKMNAYKPLDIVEDTSINLISVIVSVAKQSRIVDNSTIFLDRHVASLLAMTIYRGVLETVGRNALRLLHPTLLKANNASRDDVISHRHISRTGRSTMKNFLLLLAILTLPFAAHANLDSKAKTAKDNILQLQRQAETALRAPVTPEDLYRLTKARIWLDMALDEIYEIDRTGIVEDAMSEASRLLGGDKTNLFDTPIVRGSEKVRDDLWQKSAQMKQHKDADCAARELANLDVQLVWAGHEKWESGWTHAKPAVEVAENLAYEAEQKIARCTEARKPKDVSPSAPAVTATITVEKFTFATDALFQFDKAGVEQMVAGGQRKLGALAAALKGWKSIEKIEITGHTDRLGKDEYNNKLSLRRAENVRDFLSARGLPDEQISVNGLGEAEPIVHCNGTKKDAGLIACLQPNRRVEISVRGEKQ